MTKQLTLFTFRVEDAHGQPASDLELYMGMPGHAVFFRYDRRIFAHVHPSGSAPMAAIDIAARTMASPTSRILVQVKRAGHIETAGFDAQVDPEHP